MKILALAASNSLKSINKDLIKYASSLIPDGDIEFLDINDYEMPIYSIDLEEKQGIPDPASRFLDKIAKVDALLISLAEHNGNYTVAYKNLFDWATRVNQKVYQDKPLVFLSTSPGPGGARSVLSLAVESAHYFAGKVVASLSIPEFFKNFDTDKGLLTNDLLVKQLKDTLSHLQDNK
ncbi:NADPH-dependent FMN reductase [Glaciecola petra]|uniref:NAD(P)H-dependent oxidoreductase n=1 Tax=Glaciecola petra TaxID=3075602 RepID=A0ABU2ZMU7_9ALTE|nr:NAD(P)H-dependent oxidoreductase [Aestuariibacter sp. P117]MDT0593736.1 NAD(P)H-dependent oxidoreductase [Aestuariibacter sp. P117]